MRESYFKIIIPNYNNAEWLEKCLDSIFSQTYKDFTVIFVDDNSTDESVAIANSYAEKYDNIIVLPQDHKVWNGGGRNIGINYPLKSKYTLFLDSDDWFNRPECLQYVIDTIQANNEPDCISLCYDLITGTNQFYQDMTRDTPEKLVESLYVACWTKCVKSELVQLFPENTLMEDVVQHIRQCDKINTVATCHETIVCWNRNNLNSCSRDENQNLQQGKWQSSMFRYAADLMDTHCEHDYCEKHRQWRLNVVMSNIKDGKYMQ